LALLYDFREGNRILKEAIDGEERLFGYVVVNLNYPEESIEEIRTYFKYRNFVGAKIHQVFAETPVNVKRGKPAIQELARHNRPLLVHTFDERLEPYSSPLHAVEVAEEHPDLKIILGHMGGYHWMTAVKAAQQAENIYLDLQSSCIDRDKIAETVSELGAKKILFGTGMTEGAPERSLGMIEDAEITTREKEMILYKNAKDIFRL